MTELQQCQKLRDAIIFKAVCKPYPDAPEAMHTVWVNLKGKVLIENDNGYATPFHRLSKAEIAKIKDMARAFGVTFDADLKAGRRGGK